MSLKNFGGSAPRLPISNDGPRSSLALPVRSRRAVRARLLRGGLVALATGVLLCAGPAAHAEGRAPAKRWTDRFDTPSRSFSSVGRNRYFILEPGYQMVLAGGDTRLVITVLKETVRIGGVETRVVEERESEGGALKEISRNFFAIEKGTGNVFYFGEEVDIYQGGKVVGHEGAWRADQEGCRAGLAMPGTILLGARHYQEHAPVAMDRAEIIDDDVTFETPAGTFEHCLRVEETSALHPRERELKLYAPGVGLIQDEDLRLAESGAAR